MVAGTATIVPHIGSKWILGVMVTCQTLHQCSVSRPLSHCSFQFTLYLRAALCQCYVEEPRVSPSLQGEGVGEFPKAGSGFMEEPKRLMNSWLGRNLTGLAVDALQRRSLSALALHVSASMKANLRP